MLKKSNFVIVLSIFAIVFSTLACGVFSAPPATEAPQSAPAAETPINAPVESSTNPSATVPCIQLIPADELNNLLFNAPATLVENAYPGGTSCEWKYTANGAMQESLFYVKVDFSDGAAAMWEATRKSELSNEPSDIVVNSITGLGNESYTWSSKSTGQYVVYVRKGDKTMIMRYNAQDILYMNNEAGIIDMANRIFNRF
jgi:hypothetical protein